MKLVFSKTKSSSKTISISGGFNINLLDHDTCEKAKDFLTLIYKNSMIPIINIPTRVKRMAAPAMDHILTNSFIDSYFKTTIIESNVSDNFPICFMILSLKHQA